ncbi:MAG: hypothetical protein HYX68_22975 [Planctomycetes bacterium]|nr:hypothetical protein [Planctomycetota bacterium]
MRTAGFLVCALFLLFVALGCQRESPPVAKASPNDDRDKPPGQSIKKLASDENVKTKDARKDKVKDRVARADDARVKKGEAAADEKKNPASKPASDPLAKAMPLHAPPLGVGTPQSPIWPDLSEFAERMRGIATNERAIKFGLSPLYRATFSTRNFRQDVPLKWASGRNAVVFAGRYDPIKQLNTWDFFFWFQNKGNRFVNGKFFAEARDVCFITVPLPMDADVASAWNSALQAGNLEVTVWFRLERVARKRWAVLPDELMPGRLYHDLAFDAKLLGFESNVGKVK